MLARDVARLFAKNVPQGDRAHMLCWFSRAAAVCDIPPLLDHGEMLRWFHLAAARGLVPPFLGGLCWALGMIDSAAPGYAEEVIGRLARVPGVGVGPYEAVLQIFAEVYAAAGAAEVADRDGDGRPIFTHEPRAAGGGKNPEYESRANGIWYAVEVKMPMLIEHRKGRASLPWQLLARYPRRMFDGWPTTLPRDNPVKDFLVSANEKFREYAKARPDAFRVLTIVWDDYCNEPITALLHPVSGLLTPNSFHTKDGAPVSYPFVDAVLVCRYHHQLMRVAGNKQMIDGETLPFVYHHGGFPLKALVANPAGRPLPERLLVALNATPVGLCIGAEYAPMDLVVWVSRAVGPPGGASG